MQNCERSSYLRIQVSPTVTRERLDAVRYNLFQSGLYFLENVRRNENGSKKQFYK